MPRISNLKIIIMQNYSKKIFIISVIFFLVVCGYSCKPLVLVQLCDPQLGFDPDGFEADAQRLRMAVDSINELSPDAVLIAGDVTHIMTDSSVNVFLKIIEGLKSPIIMTPGNHDIADPVTKGGLEYYRKIFGPDYHSHKIKGYKIISANSQLWREAPIDEVDKHEQWLKHELSEAKRKKTPIILMTHVPPFIEAKDEVDEYFNIPRIKREEILDNCIRNGVFIWLAGHIHKTMEREHEGMAILNGETTSNNFDGRPYGFRILTIKKDRSFTWEFKELKQE